MNTPKCSFIKMLFFLIALSVIGSCTEDSILNPADNPVSNYTTMYLRGSMNDWATTPMTLVTNYTWQITTNLVAGSYSFKFDATGTWNATSEWGDDGADGVCDLKGDNMVLNCGGGPVTITFNDDTLVYSVEGSLSVYRKQPYLILGTNSRSVSVLWQASRAVTNAVIEWGSTTAYGSDSQITDYGTDYQYIQIFENLPYSTRIYYRVNMEGQSHTGSFISPPDPNATSLTFYAWGDGRGNASKQNDVLYRLLQDVNSSSNTRQTLALHPGDWVLDGNNEGDWDAGFFDSSRESTMQFLRNIPLMGVRGNHEGNGQLLRKYFPYGYQDASGCYYSFDYGPIHVAYVDQYVGDNPATETEPACYSPGSTQYTWLSNDLANTTRKWKFVVYHAATWTGSQYHPPCYYAQTNLHPLFKNLGVNMVFNSHVHLYSRSVADGVTYIVTAGAGGGLHDHTPGLPNVVTYTKMYHFCRIDISNNTNLQLTAIDEDGNTIETFHYTNTNM